MINIAPFQSPPHGEGAVDGCRWDQGSASCAEKLAGIKSILGLACMYAVIVVVVYAK